MRAGERFAPRPRSRRSLSQTCSSGGGVVRSYLVSGVEYSQASGVGERRIRAGFRRRLGGGVTSLVCIGVDHPGAEGLLKVLGPDRDGPVRTVRAADPHARSWQWRPWAALRGALFGAGDPGAGCDDQRGESLIPWFRSIGRLACIAAPPRLRHDPPRSPIAL